MSSLIIAIILTSFSAYAQLRIVQNWQASADTTELYGIAAIDSNTYHVQNLTRAFLITEGNSTISTSFLANVPISAAVPTNTKLRLFYGYIQSIPDFFSNDAWLLWQELGDTSQTDTTLCTLDYPISGIMLGSYTKVRGFGKYIPEYNRIITSGHVSGIVKLNGNDAEITTERTIIFSVLNNELTAVTKLNTASGYYAGYGLATSHTPQYYQPQLINLNTGSTQALPELRSDAGYSCASVMVNDTTLQTNLGRWNFEVNSDTLRVVNYTSTKLGVPVRILNLTSYNAIALVYYSAKPNIVLLDNNTLDTLAEYTVEDNPTSADVGADSSSLVIGTLRGMVYKYSIERVSSIRETSTETTALHVVANSHISVSTAHNISSLRIYNMLGEIVCDTQNTISDPLLPGLYFVIVEHQNGTLTTHTISTH